MMNNYLNLFLCGFLALTLSSCASRHAAPAPLVFAHWQAEKRVIKEKAGKPFYYSIDVSYPEILSHPNTASAQTLNQLIRDFVSSSIQQFKKTVPQDSIELHDYPLEMRNNEFRITYFLHFIKPRQHTIISLRLETDTLFFGEAHHLHRFRVINYDLSEGKLLTLASLFKPHSAYLEKLARSCQKELSSRLGEDMIWMPWDLDASKPHPENFTLWNLDKKGLIITYQEYQVTPYSSEAQMITVPYSILRPLLAEASPVSAYAYSHSA